MRHSAAVLANVVPGFGLYVDERLCAECHPTQAASYPHTGHAQTLQPATQWPFAAALDGMTFQDPERGIKYHYRFDPQKGLSVTVPERLGSDSFPLTYAVRVGETQSDVLDVDSQSSWRDGRHRAPRLGPQRPGRSRPGTHAGPPRSTSRRSRSSSSAG